MAATGGREIPVYATDPLDRRITARFGVFSAGDGVKTAVVEMAAASGLSLVGEDNRAMEASTFGTGELIKAALDEKCGRIIVGIGGSATTDGGTGMATALGARFVDIDGEPVPPGGGRLVRLEKIELGAIDARLRQTDILVACDVDNPLFGQKGAAHVYAPQKGADTQEVEELDRGLRRLAQVVAESPGIDIADMRGAGAAGGLGAGLVAFTGAKLVSGVDLIGDAIDLSARIAKADLVITGEGRIDSQTLRGKTPIGVAKRAREAGVPVVAIAGTIGDGAEKVYEAGISAMEPLCAGPMSLEEALANAADLLESAAERLMRAIGVGAGIAPI